MSSKSENRYYNHEIKTNFIKWYSKQKTVNSYYWTHLFSNSKPEEETLKKDVCNFTLSQIVSLLKGYRTPSIAALRVKVSVLRSYTQYCIDHNFSRDGLNHFDELTTEILTQCVDRTRSVEKILSYDVVMDYVSHLRNPKDQFMVLATYEGLCGQTIEQMVNIKVSDILSNNKIRVDDMPMTVSKTLYEIAKEAGETMEYYRSNDKACALMDTPYILKPMAVASVKTDQMNIRAVIRKLNGLGATGELPISYLNLKYSGFLYRLAEIVNRYGDPEDIDRIWNTKEYEALCLRYNISGSRVKIKQLYEDYQTAIEEISAVS